MLDFGGTAQKLWVLHCLDSFRPFLSVANLGLLSSFVVSHFAYLGFQSKEKVIDMLPHIGWYWSLSWLLCLSCIGNLVLCYCLPILERSNLEPELASKSLHWVISVDCTKWSDGQILMLLPCTPKFTQTSINVDKKCLYSFEYQPASTSCQTPKY